MEFKVQDTEEEAELSDTAAKALEQIERLNYEVALTAKEIPAERIRKYGFAFCGKRVLIGVKRYWMPLAPACLRHGRKPGRRTYSYAQNVVKIIN